MFCRRNNRDGASVPVLTPAVGVQREGSERKGLHNNRCLDVGWTDGSLRVGS